MVSHSPLRRVDFFNSVGRPLPGLVDIRRDNLTRLSIDERSAIKDIRFFGEIDFVFFRRFSDGRSSQVSAYIVDNTEERLSREKLAELHRQVWLHGNVPLLYVAWPGSIDVLACVRQPDFWTDGNDIVEYSPVRQFPVNMIKTATSINQELKRFSAFRLSDGTFWEEPENRELVQYDKAAHQMLIQAVVETDKELKGNENPISRRLLLLMVLIKYLEDREVFPKNFFGKYCKGARNFLDVLQNGNPEEVKLLLAALEAQFDGDLFVLPHGILNRQILEKFSILVDARTIGRQGYLWRQFSFRHLPVEIISHLYQRFVNRGSGKVYTPPFLASLLLDQAMPYSKLTGNETIIDPACGSGVFLVGAFKRLINVWCSRNNWQQPDVDTLKKILRNSIYGIDVDADAVDLTAFSLSLAICDVLQPDVIWKDLKFDSLHKSNLIKHDFFHILRHSIAGHSTIFDQKFDIVIGNPPFESKLSKNAQEMDKMLKSRNPVRGEVPDKQTAYLFLENAFEIVRQKGRICLIQPSSILYKSGTEAFRNYICSKHKIETVLDFTSIRGLYDGADPKTVAILARAVASSENDQIRHWTFRRTASVRERVCFELDHYDRHRVPYTRAISGSAIWRENLLGGGRLSELGAKLRNGRTLAQFVRSKTWDYGEGFIPGKQDPNKRLRKAHYLTGKPFLPTRAFTDNGIDESKIGIVEYEYFESPRNPDRYTAPIILIKEIDTFPMVFLEKKSIAYKNQIVGISAPEWEAKDLYEFFKRLLKNRNIYRFFCAINGTRSLIDKATAIYKSDIDNLPYHNDNEAFALSFWEESICDDTLKYMVEYVRLGQASFLLQKSADTQDLHNYAEMFVRLLGSIYGNLRASKPLFLDGLVCQPFYFGSQPDFDWVDKERSEDLKSLIYNQDKNGGLRTVRVLRLYTRNMLILIKPDRLRYWITSVAIRDADETLFDLRGQGY